MKVYRVLIPVSLLIWTGMCLAISFMEAPLKFTAPGITTELGLGIGRVVFHGLNKAEWIFAFAAIIGIFFCSTQKNTFVFFMMAWCILIYQTFLLLPQLDARAIEILDGNPQPSSYHHILYIILEAVKIFCLLISSILFINQHMKKI